MLTGHREEIAPQLSILLQFIFDIVDIIINIL